MNLKKELLELIENNARMTDQEIAMRLQISEEEAVNLRAEMEEKKIICGYGTLVNWDNTDREYVTALIEVKVTPQREQGFDNIARRIYNFKEVKAVYLMSGAYDFIIIMEGKNIKEISKFISTKLSVLDNVLSTATHFVLIKYKDHGVIIDDTVKNDERMIVSP